MKKVLTVMASIVTVFLCLMPSQVFAWYTHCVNGACSSSNGGVEVQWNCFNMRDIYHGVLTGIKGLPIGIEELSKNPQPRKHLPPQKFQQEQEQIQEKKMSFQENNPCHSQKQWERA